MRVAEVGEARMNARVRGLIIVLAAGLLSLSFPAGSTARAQDRPGAPAPSTTNGNPDNWAPPPPGLKTYPAYGRLQYSCSGPGASANSGFPPCPPGVASVSKPLPPAAEGLKRIERMNQQVGKLDVQGRHAPRPLRRLDPSIEAWMNSPAYKAWAATHDMTGPPVWNCGHGKLSHTPCKWSP